MLYTKKIIRLTTGENKIILLLTDNVLKVVLYNNKKLRKKIVPEYRRVIHKNKTISDVSMSHNISVQFVDFR